MSTVKSTFKSAVESIGRAEVKRDDLAAEVAASRDWTTRTRGDVAEAIRAFGGWTKETCPARTKGPKGEQVVTTFGVGFSALESAITRLVKEDKPVTVALRVSLSGEGGGSTVVPADHPLYDALVALVTASAAE